MLLVSDIHGAFSALARVAAAGETLLVLGDLINFVDYRTTDGIMAEIFGSEFVAQVAAARGRGDLDTNRRLWVRHAAGREDEVRAKVAELVAEQYERCREALAPARGYVTYGNVDWPERLQAILPPGCRFVDGEAVEIEGITVGFVGGGAPTVIQARGEVNDDLMESKLARDRRGRGALLASPPGGASAPHRCGDRATRACLAAAARLHTAGSAEVSLLWRRPPAPGHHVAGRRHEVCQRRLFPGDRETGAASHYRGSSGW